VRYEQAIAVSLIISIGLRKKKNLISLRVLSMSVPSVSFLLQYNGFVKEVTN